MTNQLVLTHLWIDDGLLMAKDANLGLIALCTEEAFNLGPNDSLKQHWKVTSTGTKYRKIRGTKRCYSPVEINLLRKLTAETELFEKIKASYDNLINEI